MSFGEGKNVGMRRIYEVAWWGRQVFCVYYNPILLSIVIPSLSPFFFQKLQIFIFIFYADVRRFGKFQNDAASQELPGTTGGGRSTQDGSLSRFHRRPTTVTFLLSWLEFEFLIEGM